jgi:hypothetical protein
MPITKKSKLNTLRKKTTSVRYVMGKEQTFTIRKEGASSYLTSPHSWFFAAPVTINATTK